jgi:hypothetical protein
VHSLLYCRYTAVPALVITHIDRKGENSKTDLASTIAICGTALTFLYCDVGLESLQQASVVVVVS